MRREESAQAQASASRATVGRERPAAALEALAAASGSTSSNPSSTGGRVGPKPKPTTTTAPPDPRVVHVPASIDAQGGHDVTTEMMDFIRGVSDHCTIVFPAGAKYKVDGTLQLHNRNDLVIEANGATFFSNNDGAAAPRPSSGKDDGLAALRAHWPRHRAHWVLWGSSGIIVRNCHLEGSGRQGITVADGNNVILES